jgi:phytoene/squalene synthetase
MCTIGCRKILKKHYQHAYKILNNKLEERKNAFITKDFNNPVRGKYVKLFFDYNIPFEYSNSFFQSMIRDCNFFRYDTEKQLNEYVYGSAASIGLMMCHLIGIKNTEAFPYARSLGDAMQFTNFLRDIKQDYIYLDRIYLPSQNLKKYNLTHNDIIDFSNNFLSKDLSKRQSFKYYLKDQIKYYREMYT